MLVSKCDEVNIRQPIADKYGLAGTSGYFLMAKSPNFQETLKRMLETPPKENKPLSHEDGEGESKTRPKKS